jgi:hypothetical protein
MLNGSTSLKLDVSIASTFNMATASQREIEEHIQNCPNCKELSYKYWERQKTLTKVADRAFAEIINKISEMRISVPDFKEREVLLFDKPRTHSSQRMLQRSFNNLRVEEALFDAIPLAIDITTTGLKVSATTSIKDGIHYRNLTIVVYSNFKDKTVGIASAFDPSALPWLQYDNQKGKKCCKECQKGKIRHEIISNRRF